MTEKADALATTADPMSPAGTESGDNVMPIDHVSKMILSVQELDSNEREEYERRLQANKGLIEELGARVGQATTEKAELEIEKQMAEKLVAEQALQIAHLQEINKAQSDLLENNENDDSTGDFSKLKFMMNTNQKLIAELAQAQEDIQQARQQVTEKERLCLDLSTQLDKLAHQLNIADEGMADVKNDASEKQKALLQAQTRIKMLETSLLESEQGDDGQGRGLLLKKLKEKEEGCKQLEKERNVSLRKATQLSLALARVKEEADALQAKLDDQKSVADRFFGKPNSKPDVNTSTAVSPMAACPRPTRGTPRRAKSYDRSALVRNLTPTADSLASPGQESNTTMGPFDGRRIRSLFNRGKNAGTPSNQNATTAAGTSTVTRNFFQRKSSDETNNGGSESSPFDDNPNSEFTNKAIGKADVMDEDRNGGGGDVNLALTL